MDRQRNVTSSAELESQLGQICLPIDEVLPQCLCQWLTAFAYSNGTTSGCCFVLRWYSRDLCWLIQHWSFLAHTRRRQTFTLLVLLLINASSCTYRDIKQEFVGEHKRCIRVAQGVPRATLAYWVNCSPWNFQDPLYSDKHTDDTGTSCFNIVNSVVQILYNKKFPWLHHQHAQYQYESRSCN